MRAAGNAPPFRPANSAPCCCTGGSRRGLRLLDLPADLPFSSRREARQSLGSVVSRGGAMAAARGSPAGLRIRSTPALCRWCPGPPAQPGYGLGGVEMNLEQPFCAPPNKTQNFEADLQAGLQNSGSNCQVERWFASGNLPANRVRRIRQQLVLKASSTAVGPGTGIIGFARAADPTGSRSTRKPHGEAQPAQCGQRQSKQIRFDNCTGAASKGRQPLRRSRRVRAVPL